MGDPFGGCDNFVNHEEIKGKIVIVHEGKTIRRFVAHFLGDGNCDDQEKAKKILDFGGVGMLLEGTNGSLGKS